MQATDLVILDCYKPVFDIKADVYLLWGGRDKGASYFIAQRLILDCLTDDYFRCVLVRKTYESIRDSQYQTIKDIVDQNNMNHLFTFLKSPLEIHCNINTNKFIARGCDNPAKMKSLKDPNVVHIEEADQLNEDDYITLHTTLRHETAHIRQWLSFNSDFKGNYEEHFIWQYYLSRVSSTYESGLYDTDIDLPLDNGETVTERLTFYSHHGTYKQNPHCPPKRAATYEALKDQSPYYYQVYTLGMLGKKKNENPWLWALDEDIHFTSGRYTANKNYQLILSFDFNHDPCALVIGQYEQHVPRYNVIAYYKASSAERSAIEQLCERVKQDYAHHYRTRQIVITGDASGKQRDANRPSRLNRYSDICRYLGVNERSVKIERANTSHKASRDLCNDVLRMPRGAYMFWGGRGCEMLIEESQSAYPDDKESLNRAKKELGLHGFDAWRYLNQYWFAHRLKGASFKEYKRKINAVSMRLNTR